MKKIVTIITLVLAMCLTMAFPASAAIYVKYYNNVNWDYLLDKAKNEILSRTGNASGYPTGYDYVIFYSISTRGQFESSNCSFQFIVSDSPVITAGSKRYYFGTVNFNGTINHRSMVQGTYTTISKIDAVTYKDGRLYLALKNSDSSSSSSHSIYGIVTEKSNANFLDYYSMYNTVLSYGFDIDWLVNPILDISALQSLLTQAKSMQNTGYTQSSWNTLQIQINAAENLLASTGYTQEQIDNAKNALQTAINGLVLLPDTSSLQALIKQAESIPKEGYVTSTYNALLSAISRAKLFLLRTDFTQQEVTNEITNLQTAINGLVLLPDTTELQELVVIADEIQDDGYSRPTWNRFDTARTNAHVLLNSVTYTASQVSSTTTELRVSMENLRLLPNASTLQALITEAKTYLNDLYDDFSLQVLNSKIGQALVLLDNKDYTDAQIEKMMAEIIEAIESLVLRKPSESSDSTKIIVGGVEWYTLNGEQAKYTDLINGVKDNHLNPIKDAVSENVGVARKYGYWVWFLILVPIIIVIVARNFLSGIGSNISLDMTHKDSSDGIRLTAWKRRKDDRHWDQLR